MKKRWIAIAFAAIIILVSGVLINKNFIRERNVFDQMYYTRVHKHFDWWNPGDFNGLFSNMKQLEPIGREEELIHTQLGGFPETYKPEHLGADKYLLIYCDSENSLLEISYYTNYQLENEYYYTYEYIVRDKKLTYKTNDPNDTERDFLYDIFLSDWFEANPDTRFSLENLGKFEIVDEIP